ncbi:MAG: hypothetical protein VX032_10970, partial [SAR324 cluster bacterium]|nr:hypothetical protein [SAR324 cluster bacterium]
TPSSPFGFLHPERQNNTEQAMENPIMNNPSLRKRFLLKLDSAEWILILRSLRMKYNRCLLAVIKK